MRKPLSFAGRIAGIVLLLAAAGCTGPTFVPPARPGESVADVLLPGGKPIGLPDETARVYGGGGDAANALFNRLTEGAADITPAGFPGRVRQRADGTKVTFLRPGANNESLPAVVVEVAVPGQGVVLRRIAFPPGLKFDGGGGM